MDPLIIAALAGGASSLLGGLMGGNEPDTTASDLAAAISWGQWKRYKQKYMPMENRLLEEAQAPIEQQPGFLQAMGQVDRGYADTAANLRRTLAGRYQYGAGLEGEAQKNLELRRPVAKAGVYNDFANQRYSKMANLLSMGKGMPAQATSGLMGAENLQASLANMANQQQNQTYSSAGAGMGNLLQLYLMMNRNQSPASSPPSYGGGLFGGYQG